MNTPDGPDSKPTQGNDPDAPATSGAYLSPKLREKLMGGGDTGGDDDDWKPKPQSPVPLIITVAIVAAVIGGLVFMGQAKKAAQHKVELQARADSVAAAAAAEQAMLAAQADSVRKAATAESLAVIKGKADVLAAAKAAGPFAIQAGTYLDEPRANSESAKLAASTGLPVKVKPASENGATVYRVLVGSFDTRAIAETRGLDLMGKGKLNQALVVSLKNK